MKYTLGNYEGSLEILRIIRQIRDSIQINVRLYMLLTYFYDIW